MSWLRAFLVAILLAGAVPGAQAGAVLDRIRAHKAIRCGGEPRPGLVGIEEDGKAAGLFLDLCRAIGAAVLATDGRVDIDQYDSSTAYDRVRDGTDDVAFLGADEILAEGLAGKVLPGPPVFYESTAIMVSDGSPVRHLAGLAGQAVCFSLGSGAQRHLEAWLAAHRLDVIRMGYQEDVELYDTYNAKVCGALAAETTTLADVRRDPGVNRLQSRILPEPLAVFPIVATTPMADPEFAAIVAWAIHTLIRAETPAAPWAAGGIDSLPMTGAELTLDKGWQARMIAATGNYGDIFRRDLGEGSPYKLAVGLNAPLQEGGLFVAPYAQ